MSLPDDADLCGRQKKTPDPLGHAHHKFTSSWPLVLNQATPDRTIVEEKTKLPVKSGVVESSQTTTTDVQKGVSSEPFEDTEAADEGPAASNEDYTKEACRKQATHR